MVFTLKQKDSGKFLITDIIYFIFSKFYNFYAPSIFNPQSFVHIIDKNSEFTCFTKHVYYIFYNFIFYTSPHFQIDIYWLMLQKRATYPFINIYFDIYLLHLLIYKETTYVINHCFQIGKGVGHGCILPPCLFNLYAEYIMQNARLDEAQGGIKIARRNINNLTYADDMSLIIESE